MIEIKNIELIISEILDRIERLEDSVYGQAPLFENFPTDRLKKDVLINHIKKVLK